MPASYFLDAANLPAMEDWLRRAGWIPEWQSILTAERAGEGNMNCTLRVTTAEGTFILKQARPWVEKYPSIPAPDSRANVEAAIYRQLGTDPFLSSLMPRLLAHSAEARMLMLEDLAPATDFNSVYSGGAITPAELRILTSWLRQLHAAFADPAMAPAFTNTAMRELNHAHIFDLPLRPDTGWDLDAWTPGLRAVAQSLWSDDRYCRRVRELGAMYLGDGTCLLHGDYFPGSWMRARGSVRILDPEFGFWGVPEFDLGVLLAHLRLAGRPESDIDAVAAVYPLAESPLAGAFAGVEIMRRLIGVAQLPLVRDIAGKKELLEKSRQLIADI